MTPEGATINGKHTWQYFNMIPKSKLLFAPPKPKYIFQDLQGGNGQLDYTEFLTGRVQYENRRGTFEFLVLPGYAYDLTYKRALNVFDGSVMTCVLDDDPMHEYKGRFWVSEWKSWEGHSMIAIDYDVEPYRYSTENISTLDWDFDEVIEGNLDIYYGSFSTVNTKWRNLIIPGDAEVTPTFNCSSDMQVEKDGVMYTLSAGENTNPGFLLEPGENQLVFYGSGTVTMDYDLGKTL